ncbi:MAG: hypothetical protein ACP5FT_04180 [Acidilobus sp.]
MEKLLRRAVRNKVILTAVIAAVGAVLVSMSSTWGRWALILGSAIVLLSPWLSYGLIIVMYKDKVLRYEDDEATG